MRSVMRSGMTLPRPSMTVAMAVRQERSARTKRQLLKRRLLKLRLLKRQLLKLRLLKLQRLKRQPSSQQEMTVAAIEYSSAQHDGFRIWIP